MGIKLHGNVRTLFQPVLIQDASNATGAGIFNIFFKDTSICHLYSILYTLPGKEPKYTTYVISHLSRSSHEKALDACAVRHVTLFLFDSREKAYRLI
jgi:hypothetical protein